MGWFFGFKLHLLSNHQGQIMALKITGGNGDRAPLGTGSQPCLLQLGNGATLTLSLEAALRHDGGDAEAGFGRDLGGGIALLAHANSRSLGEVGTFRGALD